MLASPCCHCVQLTVVLFSRASKHVISCSTACYSCTKASLLLASLVLAGSTTGHTSHWSSRVVPRNWRVFWTSVATLTASSSMIPGLLFSNTCLAIAGSMPIKNLLLSLLVLISEMFGRREGSWIKLSCSAGAFFKFSMLNFDSSGNSTLYWIICHEVRSG